MTKEITGTDTVTGCVSSRSTARYPDRAATSSDDHIRKLLA